MELPFTSAQFLELFRRYNEAIWPAHYVAYLVGLVTVGWALTSRTRLASAALGVMWLWNGIAYHWIFFRTINPAASAFAVLFVVEAALLFSRGLQNHPFEPTLPGLRLVGILFIVYAMAIYPIVGNLMGHPYPENPAFGLAPCPTVIFTFGILMSIDRRVGRSLLIAPLIWALVGGSAAFVLGMREDFGLPAAALAALAAMIASWFKSPRPQLPTVKVS